MEHEKCHICNLDLQGCDLYNACKNPYQFIKDKCHECGLVYHLNCYMAEKKWLYGSKQIQRDYLKLDYICYKCSEKIRGEYLMTDFVRVNSRVLRNTETRKMDR
jgi:hypothetical protein